MPWLLYMQHDGLLLYLLPNIGFKGEQLHLGRILYHPILHLLIFSPLLQSQPQGFKLVELAQKGPAG